jgi:hypothetical protein
MAFGLPKMGELTAQLNEKFDRLYTILVEIRDLLRDRLPDEGEQ